MGKKPKKDVGPTGKKGETWLKNGKIGQKIGQTYCHLPIFRPFFPPFSRWGPNPFFGHFLRPEMGSVQGNRDRKIWVANLGGNAEMSYQNNLPI